jgi:hypothetical protein
MNNEILEKHITDILCQELEGGAYGINVPRFERIQRATAAIIAYLSPTIEPIAADMPEGWLQPFEKFPELTHFVLQMASSGMVPHGSGWTSFLYELNEVCKLASPTKEMEAAPTKEPAGEPLYPDLDWEAKEIRRRIEQQGTANAEAVSFLVERAFVIGYFNRPDPPASFVDDIADGNLKEAWERCKSFLLPPLPSEREQGEDIPEEIKEWIERQDRDYPGSGHAIGWKKGARAMYHKDQEVIQMYVDVAADRQSFIDKQTKEIEALKKERDDYRDALEEYATLESSYIADLVLAKYHK